MIPLVPYDPAWGLTFDALRQRLTTALGDLAIAIEHVGSTAVPGLVAKPIIDIDVLVSPDRVDEAIERLGSIGYVHEGNLGIPGRAAFRRPRGTPDHHLYVCPQGSREYVRHLRFRDHLRRDAAATRAYAELKLAAARAAGADRDAYTRMKSEFVERTISPRVERMESAADGEMFIPVLETARLVLRGWRGADRELFARLNEDPSVMAHFPARLSRLESDAFVDRIEGQFRERGFGLWAVERRSDRAFLGFTGLWEPTFAAHFTPAIEVGWRLAAEAWGHGYATEAAGRAVAFGFENLGLDEIVSMTTPANARSRRVMEKLQMTHDPTDDFDHPGVSSGRFRRHVLYRLSRLRWEASIREAQA